MQAIVDYLALSGFFYVLATVVPLLSLAMLVMLTIALALVRRAVTLPAWIVVATAHRCITLVCAIVFHFVVLVIHLFPLLFANS